MFPIHSTLKLTEAPRLLLALILAGAAGCSVSEAGTIPCKEDASCPRDYPVCTAGLCVAGTSPGDATAAIVGVQGKQAADPVRGTVTVQVSARAASGVQSLSLAAGGKTFAPTTPPVGTVYSIAVDTTGLADGAAHLIATVTAADGKTFTTATAFDLLVDNTAPTLTAGAAIPDASIGTMVTLDVTASEALGTLTAQIFSGSSLVGSAIEIAAPTGLVHHLGFAVTTGLATGTYSFSITATDQAGNPSTTALVHPFNVRVPVPLTDLTVVNATGVTEAGLAAATTGSVLNVTLNLPPGLTLPAAKTPIFTLTKPDSTTATLAASGGPASWTASYTVLSSDSAGLATIRAQVTDTAQNVSSQVRQFLIDKTAPSIAGVSVLPKNVHTGGQVTLTGVASKRLSAATVIIDSGDSGLCTCDGGDCATSTSGAPAISCTIVVSAASASANAPRIATATVSLQDRLGNLSPSLTSPLVVLYQGSYAIQPPLGTPTLTPGASKITKGTSTLLMPVFTGGSGFITADSGNAPGAAVSGVGTAVAPTTDTNYTLTVSSPAGDSVPTSASVLVYDPPAGTLVSDKPNISVGQSANLTATFNAGRSGTMSFASSPLDSSVPVGPPVSGQPFVVSPAVTTTYTLTVTNGAGLQLPQKVTIFVGQAVSTSLTAPALAIKPGDTATLVANVDPKAASASIDPGGLSVTADGSDHNVLVLPSATTVYTLSATNSAGQVFRSTATVLVQPPVVSSFVGPTYFTSSKAGLALVASFPTSGVFAGSSASVNNSCTTSAPTVSPASFTCPPITADTTYTLTVKLGSGASSTATAQVLVKVAPDPVTAASLTLTGPGTVNPHGTTTLSALLCNGCAGTLTPSASSPLTSPGTGAGQLLTTNSLQADTIFTLSVTNAAGDSAVKTLLISVNRPSIGSFTGPAWVTTGKIPQLSASFATGSTASVGVGGGGNCTVHGVGGNTASVSPATFDCPPITGDTSYTLTAALGTGANSQVTATLTVKQAPDPAAALSLTGSQTINPHATAVIVAAYCNGCIATITPATATVLTSPGTGAAQSLTTAPLQATTTFTLSATNQAGDQAATSATVSVDRPTILSFSAPGFTTSGKSASLIANFGTALTSGNAGGASARVDVLGGGSCNVGSLGGSATTSTSPATFVCPAMSGVSQSYTLTVILGTGANSTVSSNQVTVVAAPDPASSSLTTTTDNVNPGTAGAVQATVCSGCTATISPVTATSLAATGDGSPHVLTTANLDTTTLFTLSVTNQAGDQTAIQTTVNVNRPRVVTFVPVSPVVTSGATGASAPQFGVSVVAATVALNLVNADGSLGTAVCTQGSSSSTGGITSTSFGSCPSITANTTYRLTATLGAGPSSTATADALVKVADNPAVALGFTASPPLLPFNGSNAVSLTAKFCPNTPSLCTATFLTNGAGSAIIGSGVAAVPAASPLPATTTFTLVVTNQAGAAASRELTVDVLTGRFSSGTMASARFDATATLLTSGKVLITGGRSTNNTNASALTTAEIYDPGTGQFSNLTGGVKTLSDPKFSHTATLLPNGQVFIAGGYIANGTAVNSSDIYDPTTDTFIPVGANMKKSRGLHVAVVIPAGPETGHVLLAGGAGNIGSAGDSTCEIFTPGAGTFANCPGGVTMQASRAGATATLIANSNLILIAGGSTGTTADVFDSTQVKFTAAGAMRAARIQHTATSLPNGKILLAGGSSTLAGAPLASAEVYDSAANAFTSTGGNATPTTLTTARYTQVAIVLGGAVLIAGGNTGTNAAPVATDTLEVYDPIADAFGITTFAGGARLLQTRTQLFGTPLLTEGRALIGGGTSVASAADVIIP